MRINLQSYVIEKLKIVSINRYINTQNVNFIHRLESMYWNLIGSIKKQKQLEIKKLYVF